VNNKQFDEVLEGLIYFLTNYLFAFRLCYPL